MLVDTVWVKERVVALCRHMCYTYVNISSKLDISLSRKQRSSGGVGMISILFSFVIATEPVYNKNPDLPFSSGYENNQ